jgi:hypothetical protein
MAGSKSPKKTGASDGSSPPVDASTAVSGKEPTSAVEPAPEERRTRSARFWRGARIPAVAACVGLLLGVVVGVASQDPTSSREYQGLEAQLHDSRTVLENVTSERDKLIGADCGHGS